LDVEEEEFGVWCLPLRRFLFRSWIPGHSSFLLAFFGDFLFGHHHSTRSPTPVSAKAERQPTRQSPRQLYSPFFYHLSFSRVHFQFGNTTTACSVSQRHFPVTSTSIAAWTALDMQHPRGHPRPARNKIILPFLFTLVVHSNPPGNLANLTCGGCVDQFDGSAFPDR
jgi:hypothetical protein